MDTSPNEVWKAVVNPAWAAALKITARSIQFHIDPVIFLVQWLVAAPLKMLNKRRSAYEVTEVYILIGHL